MISTELESVLHHSYVSARQACHNPFPIAHVLLQLLNVSTVAGFLASRSVDIAAVRASLLSDIAAVPASVSSEDGINCQPEQELQSALQRTILAAMKAKSSKVMALDLFKELAQSSPMLKRIL